jgi:hypothetical protein
MNETYRAIEVPKSGESSQVRKPMRYAQIDGESSSEACLYQEKRSQ